MKKRLLALIVSMVMLCGMLAGCSGKNTNDGGANVATEDENKKNENENVNATDFSWIDTYVEYLESEGLDYYRYSLIDVDGDSVLEIYAEADVEGYLLSISDGAVQCRYIDYGGMYYIPGENKIYISEMDNGYSDKLGCLKNGKVVIDHEGVSREEGSGYVYEWDGESVTHEVYSENFSGVWDSSKAEYVHGRMPLNQFILKIQAIAKINDETSQAIVRKEEFKKTNCDGGGVMNEYTNEFDEEGRLISYYYFEEGNEMDPQIQINYTVEWEVSGLVATGTCSNGNTIKEEYNDSGQLISTTTYNAKDELISKKDYQYFGAILIEETETDSKDQLIENSKYNYFGDLLEHYVYKNGYCESARTYEYTYNTDGTIANAFVRHTYLEQYKSEYYLNYEYIYNSNGMLSEFNIYKPVEGYGNETEHYAYTYWGEEVDENEMVTYDVEAEVEQIREWYYSTQENLSSLLMASYSDDIDAYFDGAYARKVVVPSGYCDDNSSKEYFFHDRKLYFAFVIDDGGEHRFYFKDDVLIRYIGPDGVVYNYGDSVLNNLKDRANYLNSEATELESGMVNCGN